MTMLTTDLCDLIRELRSHFFAKDRDVILQTNRVVITNDIDIGNALDASFVTLNTNSDLDNERVLTAGAGITITDGGAGSTATVAITGGGAVPIGGIILWSGAVGAIPANWALCDGGSGTPNLTDSFVVCAGGAYAVGASGGEDASNLAHTHGPGTLNTDTDYHTHGPGTLKTDSDSHDHDVDSGATASTGAHSHNIAGDTGGASATVGNDNADGATYPIVQQSHTHGVGTLATGVSATHSHNPGTLNTASDSHGHDVDSGNTTEDYHDHDVDSGVTASGGSAAQENRPAYYALAYIMRIS